MNDQTGTEADLAQDATLLAVDAAMERAGNAEKPRPYLGMSAIGTECERDLWYGFRWCTQPRFDAATLYRFADGHQGESVQAERLRMVDGIRLYTEDPNTPGKQIGYKDIGGHFRGHMDGCIAGLKHNPDWHVWEHKQVGEQKQAKLASLKQKLGESRALQQWDDTYYAQAVVYMHYSGIHRHYLTCSEPGGRSTISVVTDANEAYALSLVEKAQSVIGSLAPPDRHACHGKDWYRCKWCAHHDTCLSGKIPLATCRTCLHATPIIGPDQKGLWRCAKYGCFLPTETQRRSSLCDGHLYIPSILPWQHLGTSSSDAVAYITEDGTRVVNGEGGYLSRELATASQIIGDPITGLLKSTFNAEVVA